MTTEHGVRISLRGCAHMSPYFLVDSLMNRFSLVVAVGAVALSTVAQQTKTSTVIGLTAGKVLDFRTDVMRQTR